MTDRSITENTKYPCARNKSIFCRLKIFPSSQATQILNIDITSYVTAKPMVNVQQKGRQYVAGGKSKYAQILFAPNTSLIILVLSISTNSLVKVIPSNITPKRDQ